VGGHAIDKAEAIAVLREIFTACPEIGRADFVSLDPDNVSAGSEGFYKIRLRVNLDKDSKQAIKSILKRHKLELMETKDLTIICRSHA
jgi:hypothetical protein